MSAYLICQLINNSEMTILYWNIGKRIKDKVLNNERAEYGKQVIKSLSENLVGLYGKGWGEKPLRLCIKFVNVFPDQKIVYALRR